MEVSLAICLLWLLAAGAASPGAGDYDSLIKGTCGVRGHARQAERQAPALNRSEVDARLRRMASAPVPVRLALFYDRSLARHLAEEPATIKDYIANILHATQLVFGQPELAASLRLLLVPVSLAETGVESSGAYADLAVLLREFGARQPVDWTRTDIAVLLTVRTVVRLESGSLTLGIADMGVLCGQAHPFGRALVLSANSMNVATVLAHELAHSLGVFHDGDPHGARERLCDPTAHLMGPSYAAHKVRWSSCSVFSMMDYVFLRFECAYQPARLASARPLGPEFDFAPGRQPLAPGQRARPEAQCSRALGRPAATSLSVYGRNGFAWDLSPCLELFCSLGGLLELGVGPALSGSPCSLADGSPGACYISACVRADAPR